MASVRTIYNLSAKLASNSQWKRKSTTNLVDILRQQGSRFLSYQATFKASDLEVEFADPSQLKFKPKVEDLKFGKDFTDHMLEIKWTEADGWGKPKISPYHNLQMDPAAKVLHYSVELFEGMKGFRGRDGQLRMFRPEMNMARMNNTAARSALPTFDGGELIELLKKLVSIDQEWVPHSESASIYIRPTMIGTEPMLGVQRPTEALLFVILSPSGPYFSTGFQPCKLLADPQYVRAWPGGCGAMKMGSNYGPTLAIQKIAEAKGMQQVLWLYGEDHQITEVGAMNLFVFLDKGNGEKELVTAGLEKGLILPGVTRNTLLTLGREWGEFKVSERDITMAEIIQAESENRLLEVFGAGTAAVVTPVGEIHFKDQVIKIPTMDHDQPLNQRFYNTITDMQYGRVQHPWAPIIE
ncbi:unnamed protein product [Meganyctiphanes norvegica]|uniref:Branched-chain-amino-acid aminotransferase n=1 Tax=Meganyctiphanes norvegica TaxID=48144 RepID=A0AAV2RRT8_MEGNR